MMVRQSGKEQRILTRQGRHLVKIDGSFFTQSQVELGAVGCSVLYEVYSKWRMGARLVIRPIVRKTIPTRNTQ